MEPEPPDRPGRTDVTKTRRPLWRVDERPVSISEEDLLAQPMRLLHPVQPLEAQQHPGPGPGRFSYLGLCLGGKNQAVKLTVNVAHVFPFPVLI